MIQKDYLSMNYNEVPVEEQKQEKKSVKRVAKEGLYAFADQR